MESCTRSLLTMFGCTAVSKPCEEERTRRYKQAHGDALCFVKRRPARRQAVMMANSRSAGGKAATKKLSMRTSTPKLAQIFLQNSAPSYAAPSCTAPIYAGGTDSLLFYAYQGFVYEYATPGENFLLVSCWELLVCTGF